MTEGSGVQVFTDEAWAVWEPLIEEDRSHGKTPPKDLRWTISAIFWRHQNGVKWRSVPAELGPLVAGGSAVLRWARHGVWERLLDLARQRGVTLGMTVIDGTSIRAYHKAAGAQKRGPTARSKTWVRLLVGLAAATAPRLV
jgi:transposase